MNCKEIKYYFPDILDNSLTPEIMDQVNKHLGECEVCRNTMEELRELLLRRSGISPTTPPQAYWGTILPGIHERIDKKASGILPEWITRLALPLTAVAVLVIFILTNYPSRLNSDSQELRTILYQLPAEELQQIDQNESVNATLETSNALMEKPEVGETDKEVLKQILLEEDHAGLYSDADSDVSTVPIDDQDTDQLLSMLEQQSLMN
jgi:hypothetical protein